MRDSASAVVGVMLVARHFPHVAEVHLMAVDRGRRGQGVGRALVDALEADAQARGARLLEVKPVADPLGPGRRSSATQTPVLGVTS